jgi:hypothetical protein
VAERIDRSNTNGKEAGTEAGTWGTIVQSHPVWEEGGRKPMKEFPPVSPQSLQHIFSLLKIFLNKELSASGRFQLSSSRSQMPGW